MPRPFSVRTVLQAGGRILLMPLLILYTSQLIWTQSFIAPFSWMVSHPGAVGMSWLLLTIFAMAIYGFVRRFAAAYAPLLLISWCIGFITFFKAEILEEPLLISDFEMAGSFGHILSYAAPMLHPTLPLIAAAILDILAVVLLVLFESERQPVSARWFIIGCVCLFLAFTAFQPGILQSAAIALDGSCSDQKDRNEQEGILLGLYVSLAQRISYTPEDFGGDAAEMAELFRAEETLPELPENAPDIIFITSESFFDITRMPNLTFEKDPLPVYHKLAGESVSGRFISNTYGGGTGNVEMAMFTGLNREYLKEGDTLCTLPERQYDTVPNLVRQLSALGYRTMALHSYNSLLYNRADNYPALGFDTVAFAKDFRTETELCGTYMSDESLAQEIIARYESRSRGKPCFLYAMSMENHQAYSADKYPDESGYPAESNLLDSSDLAVVDSLVHGLHDADAALGTLVRYFSKVDTPVLLVFVGDHLPCLNLPDGDSLYLRLGMISSEESAEMTAEELCDLLSTDYLLWSNTDASPKSAVESWMSMAPDLLQRAGLPMNAYYRWLTQEVTPSILASRGRLFVAPDGTASYDTPEDAENILRMCRAVDYRLAYTVPMGVQDTDANP